MIQVWIINILIMRSRGRTEKRKNGQKHHRTKVPKDQNQSGQNPQNMRKCFNTPTIKVNDPMIRWYRCGQSTFSSCDHVGRQWKAKIDKSTIGRKNQRIRIKADKYLIAPTIKVYNQMITWYRCRQSTFLLSDHVGGQKKGKIAKSTIGRKNQRIRIKANPPK